MCLSLPVGLTSRITYEIYDAVIEKATDSKPSLSSMSAVCRAWLPMCRRRLFRCVVLRWPLVDQLFASRHAVETILPHVRSVALGGQWIRYGLHVDIFFLMKRLERLEELHLETWNLEKVDIRSSFTTLFGHSTTLTALDMKYVRLPSFSYLIQFIGTFTLLKRLTLDNVTWDDDFFPPGSPHQFLPLLRELSLISCSNLPLLAWLFPAMSDPDFQDFGPCFPPISSLYIPEVLPEECPVIAQVLRGLGNSLVRLVLGMLPFGSCSFESRYSFSRLFRLLNPLDR